MKDILGRIVAVKRREVREAKRSIPLKEMVVRADQARPLTGFRDSLRTGFRVIAEIKRASPSKGVIREDFKPVEIAKSYLEAGAGAISVLTDREFFQGSPDFLRSVAMVSTVPVLRKDFVIDEYQIHEAKEMGAGMVLLIAACLGPFRLKRFLRLCRRIGLEALTEVHDAAELRKALSAGADLVGINNRDLRTFRTDVAVSLDLIRSIPAGIPAVSESGIRTPDDVRRLKNGGFGAILVGEAFMSASDPGKALKELMA
jgi:indole-3-glycerol phosphate synthase